MCKIFRPDGPGRCTHPSGKVWDVAPFPFWGAWDPIGAVWTPKWTISGPCSWGGRSGPKTLDLHTSSRPEQPQRGYKCPRSETGSELNPGGLPPPRPPGLGGRQPPKNLKFNVYAPGLFWVGFWPNLAKVGPRTLLNGSSSKNGAERAQNQPRRPIMKPFRS